MISRFKLSHISDISMKLSMFSSLVQPIMEYCGEVWGPPWPLAASQRS
jgi:hypothetical protein